MKTIKLLKDIPHDGLAKGDVVSFDERSAEALIKREDAEEYKAPEASGSAEAPQTIDDIVDPDVARNRRQMTATIVAAGDPGPTVAPDPLTATPKSTRPELAAPGAQPVGGDAGGGGSK